MKRRIDRRAIRRAEIAFRKLVKERDKLAHMAKTVRHPDLLPTVLKTAAVYDEAVRLTRLRFRSVGANV